VDPITLIIAALAAGASTGVIDALKDNAKDAAKAAYAKLRGLAGQRVAGNAVAETALAQYQANPKIWEAPLTDELTKAGAANDTQLVAAAQALMDLLDRAGAKSSVYNVTISGGQGIQVGKGNKQTTNYYGSGSQTAPGA
jgi:hypothetical protein